MDPGKAGKGTTLPRNEDFARGGRKGSFADERVRLGMFSPAEKSASFSPFAHRGFRCLRTVSNLVPSLFSICGPGKALHAWTTRVD